MNVDCVWYCCLFGGCFLLLGVVEGRVSFGGIRCSFYAPQYRFSDLAQILVSPLFSGRPANQIILPCVACVWNARFALFVRYWSCWGDSLSKLKNRLPGIVEQRVHCSRIWYGTSWDLSPVHKNSRFVLYISGLYL